MGGAVMTTRERNLDAEQTFKRRMAKRTCGHCGAPAEDMLDWGRQRIAICGECQDRLRQPGYHCPWDSDRPCQDCITHPVIEARVVEAEIIEPSTDLFLATETPSSRRSPLVRALSALAGYLRR